MRKIQAGKDHSDRALHRGDTVTTLNGYLTARVCDIASEEGEIFVRLRPLHQPYGPGTWHAAEHVMWVANASPRRRRRRKTAASPETETATAGSSAGAGD